MMYRKVQNRKGTLVALAITVGTYNGSGMLSASVHVSVKKDCSTKEALYLCIKNRNMLSRKPGAFSHGNHGLPRWCLPVIASQLRLDGVTKVNSER